MKAYFKAAARIHAKIAKAYRDGNISKAAAGHEEMSEVCDKMALNASEAGEAAGKEWGGNGAVLDLDEAQPRDLGDVKDLGGDLKAAAEPEVKKLVVGDRDLTPLLKVIKSGGELAITSGGRLPDEETLTAEEDAIGIVAKAVSSLASSIAEFQADTVNKMKATRGAIETLVEGMRA